MRAVDACVIFIDGRNGWAEQLVVGLVWGCPFPESRIMNAILNFGDLPTDMGNDVKEWIWRGRTILEFLEEILVHTEVSKFLFHCVAHS